VSSDGYVAVGSKSAKVSVDIYLDYHCGYCAFFEEANKADLTTFVEEGQIVLNVHTLSFLDSHSSGAQFSTRAANAAITVANESPEHFLEFHNKLLENQPGGGGNLTDEEIAALAQGIGVPASVTATFSRLAHVAWVESATQRAIYGPGTTIQGTPSVLINGSEFQGDLYSQGPLAEAINAALQ
jgi:protein-disulfide isomerase